MKRYGILVRTPDEQKGWVVLEGAIRSKDRIVPVKPMEIGERKKATLMNKQQADHFADKHLKGFPFVDIKRRGGKREK